MMKRIRDMLITLLVLAWAVPAFAGPVGYGYNYNTESNSCAMYVINGYDEEVQFLVVNSWASATNTVKVGSAYNTISGASASYDTFTEVAAAIEACTNSAGKKLLTVVRDCVAAQTETISNNVVTGSITLKAGEAGTVYKWITGNVKHYDCFIPASGHGVKRGNAVLEKIYGNVGGTGNITLNIYVDGTEKYEKVIRVPTYYATDAANLSNITNTADQVSAAQLDERIDFWVGAKQDCLVRATRATTATLGSLGVKVANE